MHTAKMYIFKRLRIEGATSVLFFVDTLYLELVVKSCTFDHNTITFILVLKEHEFPWNHSPTSIYLHGCRFDCLYFTVQAGLQFHRTTILFLPHWQCLINVHWSFSSNLLMLTFISFFDPGLRSHIQKVWNLK